ncbi:MAG: sulfatase [bacterium]
MPPPNLVPAMSLRRLDPWLVSLLVLVLCLPACGPAGNRSGGDPPTLEDCNVLLIVIDTMGAEHVGCLQPGLSHTPNIDALARKGVLFRQAYSPTSWTQPAVASLFTSLMPSRHGVLNLLDRLPFRFETLADLLRGRGFRTRAVISHNFITAQYGYAQGFEEYDTQAVGSAGAITSALVTHQAKSCLDELAAERFFLFVHYFDPHGLYNHHREFDLTHGYNGPLRPAMSVHEMRGRRHEMTAEDIDYLVGLYREEIAYTDFHVGELLLHLERTGLAENTLVILTADHGEEFMRHGWIGHTITLYDELLHVPLIWSLPGQFEPAVVETPASLLDIVPTLLALAREPHTDPAWQGISLLPVLTGAQPTPPVDRPDGAPAKPARELFAEVSFEAPEQWAGQADSEDSAFKTALLAGDLKLVHDLENNSWELYDRRLDPEELTDLTRESHPALATLQARLLAWERGRHTGAATDSTDLIAAEGDTLPEAEPDAETIRKLRALGYLD